MLIKELGCLLFSMKVLRTKAHLLTYLSFSYSVTNVFLFSPYLRNKRSFWNMKCIALKFVTISYVISKDTYSIFGYKPVKGRLWFTRNVLAYAFFAASQSIQGNVSGISKYKKQSIFFCQFCDCNAVCWKAINQLHCVSKK